MQQQREHTLSSCQIERLIQEVWRRFLVLSVSFALPYLALDVVFQPQLSPWLPGHVFPLLQPPAWP